MNPLSRRTPEYVFTVILILLFSLGVFAAPQNNQDYEAADRIFQKGEKAFLKGKFEKSKRYFIRCLEMFTGHPSAEYYLSRLELMEGHTASALLLVEQAKHKFHRFAKDTHNARVFRRTKLEETREAYKIKIKNYNEAIRAGGGNCQTSAQMTIVAEAEGRLREIDALLQEPLGDIQPIPSVFHFQHGNILFKQKQYLLAAEQYENAIVADPANGDAYNNLANVHYLLKNYPKAWESLEAAEKHKIAVNQTFKRHLQELLAQSQVSRRDN